MKKANNTFPLIEIGWEVCNQIGGIYTVLRSKAPAASKALGQKYCLIGPYFEDKAAIEFEPEETRNSRLSQAVERMRSRGFEIHYGTWLVSGKPKVILLNPASAYSQLGQIKYDLWNNHHISCDRADDLQNQVLAFGWLCKAFLQALAAAGESPVLAHFHEWMAATAILDLRRENIPVTCLFTTHATLLGRYLAMGDGHFYDRLPYYHWETEARKYDIELPVRLERAAVHGAHVFTTVSQVTARECETLLGRRPDFLLPNGINIERFTAMHEHQILHQSHKEQIHEFVMGHFFHSYSFDLDNTLYFFTSGRYEYQNKGYDICVEALARLNALLLKNNSKKTVVMFFISKRPFHSINSSVLQSRAMMEETREITEAIQAQMSKRLFHAVATRNDLNFPSLNEFVDDYWKLRLRRNLQAWKNASLPLIVTHNLQDHDGDELLNFIRQTQLVNRPEDRVKMVYHPDFLLSSNPLFNMDYGQFVRGCHLGVFPSYYEPWGYTPLECIASGVPTVTSDLAGFGNYVGENLKQYEKKGVYVVPRYGKSFHESAQILADILYKFVNQSRRERINQRNRTESSSEEFDWDKLLKHYLDAYDFALRLKP